MRKCRIIVWDYYDAIHGGSHALKDFKPVRYDVEAWCVGREEGIKAFFFVDNTICMADGDDGDWWMVDRFHMHWIHEIKDAIIAITKEERELAKTKRVKRKGCSVNA